MILSGWRTPPQHNNRKQPSASRRTNFHNNPTNPWDYYPPPLYNKATLPRGVLGFFVWQQYF